MLRSGRLADGTLGSRACPAVVGSERPAEDTGSDVFKGSPAQSTNLPGMSNDYVGPGGEVWVRLSDDIQGTGESQTITSTQ